MNMDTLQQIAAALASGKITSHELTQQMLKRAQDPNGQGAKVFTKLFADQALRAAQASDLLRQAGLSRSVLEGIPVSVKDLFDVKGQVTTSGSVVLKNTPAAEVDSTVVQRLRAAGAVVIGMTNMTEFAYSGLGINPHYGTPLSPWDRKTGHIPGGSSSGAAVSVSDGMAAAGIGSDTGGSVRIPSAFCGLTGFKPTARRIPMDGVFPLSRHLDSIGPLANSVACCAVLDAVMAGQPIRVPEAAQLKGLRLAYPLQLVRDDMDSTVSHAFDRALNTLTKAGALIQDIDLPELLELATINAGGGFTAAEAWADHAQRLATRGTEYDRRVATRIQRGQSLTAADLLVLMQARTSWIARVSRKLADVDALIMPTVPVVPPAIAPLIQDDQHYGKTNMLVLRNCSVINFLDGCALSLPAHARGEAPVGAVILVGHGTSPAAGSAPSSTAAPMLGQRVLSPGRHPRRGLHAMCARGR